MTRNEFSACKVGSIIKNIQDNSLYTVNKVSKDPNAPADGITAIELECTNNVTGAKVSVRHHHNNSVYVLASV